MLIDGRPTRQNKIELVSLAEVFDYLRPSRSIPQFFPASRAGVQNHVRPCDFPITPKPVGFFARCSRKIELRSAAGLVIASLFGIPLGLFALARMNDAAVRLVLGVLIMSFSAYSILAKQKLHLKEDHGSLLIAAGVVSGVLGGAYGMNGPPLAIYGSLRRWSPQQFRATLQGYFLPASILGLIGYAAIGLWTAAVTRYLLLSLPAALLAILLGRTLNRRLRNDGFFRYVYAGLIVIGGVLIAQAL